MRCSTAFDPQVLLFFEENFESFPPDPELHLPRGYWTEDGLSPLAGPLQYSTDRPQSILPLEDHPVTDSELTSTTPPMSDSSLPTLPLFCAPTFRMVSRQPGSPVAALEDDHFMATLPLRCPTSSFHRAWDAFSFKISIRIPGFLNVMSLARARHLAIFQLSGPSLPGRLTRNAARSSLQASFLDTLMSPSKDPFPWIPPPP